MGSSFFRVVFLLLLLTTPGIAADFARRAIQVVNVFTGVPQPSDEGSVRTGGFGDVAANLIAAVEIKSRRPELTVRLLVTSAQQRHDPIVPTTNEILGIIAPTLVSKQTTAPQIYKGVEVLFLDADFTEALKDVSLWRMRGILKKLSKQLSTSIPHADVNLNFSHFPGAARLLRINAPLALGVEEVTGSGILINEAIAPGEAHGKGAFAELASGPKALGFMLAEKLPSAQENVDLIRRWMAAQGRVPTATALVPLMAYSADWQATQIYIDALAEIPWHSDVYLFIKPFPQLDTSALPPNIHLVPIRGLPFEVMDAVIDESVISPLVTGDISWGRALSSTNPRKTFVYESPWWKIEGTARMRGMLARDIGVRQQSLDAMFLRTEAIEKLSREELRQKGRDLAGILRNDYVQGLLHASIRKHFSQWDEVANTLALAEVLSGQKNVTFGSADSQLSKTAEELNRRFVPNHWRNFKRFFAENYAVICDLALSVTKGP